MKNSTRSVLLAILCIVSVNLLASCRQKGDGQSEPAEIKGGFQATAQGTGDLGGGGTGFNDKIFESYIVDPTQLPEFKKFVAPLINNIKDSRPEDKDSNNEMVDVFKMKLWYIAPVQLEKVQKDVLGVSLVKSSTVQFARQTKRKVWIAKSLWDKMQPKARGDLLVHEMVMSFYLLKFYSMSEICLASAQLPKKKDQNDSDCNEMAKLFDKAYPAEAERTLNEKDYENINTVTAWILKYAVQPVSDKDFDKVLASNGFDKRFFGLNHDDLDDPKELKISKKDLYQAIKGAELAGQMPTFCTGLNSGKTGDCKVELIESTIEIQGYQIPGFEMRISSGKDQSPIAFKLLIGDEVELSASRGTNSETVYSFTLLSYNSKISVGDRVQTGTILFSKSRLENSPLIVESIILKHGVVTSIDKKRDPICLVREINPSGLLEDGLIIRRPGAPETFFENLYTTLPTMAACSPDNVVE